MLVFVASVILGGLSQSPSQDLWQKWKGQLFCTVCIIMEFRPYMYTSLCISPPHPQKKSSFV